MSCDIKVYFIFGIVFKTRKLLGPTDLFRLNILFKSQFLYFGGLPWGSFSYFQNMFGQNENKKVRPSIYRIFFVKGEIIFCSKIFNFGASSEVMVTLL